jgi:hypothetical protein
MGEGLPALEETPRGQIAGRRYPHRPDGKLQDSEYAYHFDGTTTLCLILNLKQGQCYTATGTAENPSFATADCDGSAPVIRVVKRIDGSTDTEPCPACGAKLARKTPSATGSS